MKNFVGLVAAVAVIVAVLFYHGQQPTVGAVVEPPPPSRSDVLFDAINGKLDALEAAPTELPEIVVTTTKPKAGRPTRKVPTPVVKPKIVERIDCSKVPAIAQGYSRAQVEAYARQYGIEEKFVRQIHLCLH